MATTPRAIGTLIIVILKARNLPNKRHIGKQDPYCVITFDGDKRRTPAVKRGGQHPEWDEEIRYTLYEDTEPEPAVATPNGAPPPPPPKKGKGPPRIKGGKFMGLACYAEDLREPDLIGETKVDLTEVLTKGETDEWFTLMHKDKYTGEVYLELTFWSNEAPPVKKATSRPKEKKNYGGPGTFVPSGGSPPPDNAATDHSRVPSGAPTDYSRDTIPSSLRTANHNAKLDLYAPPYATSRSRHHLTHSVSADSMVNEFAQLEVQDSYRRVSMPPPADDYYPRPSSSIGFVEPQSHGVQPSYGHDENAYSETASTLSYNNAQPLMSSYLAPLPTDVYQAPYEFSAPAYPPAARRPRHSIPPSSAFFPTPAPAPSGFITTPSVPPQPSGFLPPGQTPAPVGYGLQLPGPSPAALGYIQAPPPPSVPSNFTPLHHPAPSHYAPPPQPSTYQTLPPTQPNYQYRQYSPPHPNHTPTPPQQHTPPQPQPSLFAPTASPQPPRSPVPPQQTYPTAVEYGYGNPATSTQPYTQIPPPPPLHDSPKQNIGARPLPQPGQTTNHQRRQSTLPVPPSGSPASHSPTAGSRFSPMVPFNGQIPPPPPPPLPAQSGNHYAPVPHTTQGPAPPSQSPSNLPTSSFPQNNYQSPPVGPPPPLAPTRSPSDVKPKRRPSLPAPPVGHGAQQYFQTLPPPPPPPTLPHQQQEMVNISFASAHTNPTIHPGPLPRPPSQYLPQGYPISESHWQY